MIYMVAIGCKPITHMSHRDVGWQRHGTYATGEDFLTAMYRDSWRLVGLTDIDMKVQLVKS